MIAQTQTASQTRLDQLCVNTIRTLSMDAVQQANSGHPGTPMALAPSTKTRLTFAGAGDFSEHDRSGRNLQHQPAVLVLSRQALPTLDRTKYAAASGLAKGAYVLADAEDGRPEVLLLATGSEVSLCVEAYEQLKTEGIQARVVSMPSWELFEQQSQEYRDSVIPPAITARVCVEQASTFGWGEYVGSSGARIVMHTFGASAPLKELQRKFGFTPDKVVAAAKAQLTLD